MAPHMDDSGLRFLPSLPKLELLSVSHCDIHGPGLVCLASGFPKLRELWICYRPLDGLGLEHIAGLPELRLLNLSNTKLTGVGVEHITGLPKLKTLDLSFTNLTGIGLEGPAGLPKLEELDLGDTKIDDAGLARSRAQRVSSS